MDLLLVRHAAAVARAPRQAPEQDAARPLTAQGRRRFRRVRRALERLGLRADRLLHSPWVRAAQTAELLRPLVRGAPRPEPLLAAPPGRALLRRLRGRRLVLVGHQPWLGELAAWLALGDRGQGRALRWRKGGVVLLTGEPAPGRMQLAALLPPRWLRRLAR